MAFRKIGKLTKFGIKTGLAGGACYMYYEAGLWKSSDETVVNFEKVKKDAQAWYESTPADVHKWVDYCSSTVSSNVEPYSKAVSDFRKEWLNFDLSWITEKGDGIVKPTWNKGVSWTVETLKNSPDTIQKYSAIGWKKVNDLASSSITETPSTTTPLNKPTEVSSAIKN